MKRFLSILSLVILGFVSQSCYDDSALWESVNDLDSRVKTLETLCKEMNTNLASLQTLVSAMKQGDYIVDVAPLTENGVEVGYQITFYDRGTVNIYHGKDGVGSGNVPAFGAKQDTDGVYYWTVNGEWILDDKGNKLPVSSAEGAAGVTPKLKVENGKWYVSYDEGRTWEEAGSAVSDSSNGCLFKDVQLTDSAIVLTMSDGSVFTLPIGERFRIVLGEFDASTIQYGTDVVVPYTIEGAKGEVSVFVVSDGWMFETELVEETAVSGKLTIRQEDYDDEEISGKVAVFAVAEDGTTVSKVIRLLSGVLRPSSDRYNDVFTVESTASQLEFTVATNRDFEVNTNADWITYADTKAVEEKTLVFDIQENENGRRKTYVEIASGDIDFGFTVAQKGFSDAFSVNVSCDEVRGGSWEVNIDTLFNKAGQTIYEVLGYSSWEDVAAATGYWEALYNRTGEVILTAYDLYTGEALPYDARQFHNGLGFIHDSDGYLVSDWSLCKTSWDWNMIWDDTGSHLDKIFWINTNNVYAGESNSFGILFTAPEGEARIEVTVNVTEYIDPENGLYDNPAAPGRYEFTLHDKVDPDSLTHVYSSNVFNREMAEIIKSILGMTTYEISQVAGRMDREYQLNNGDSWDGYSDIRLDVNGHVTDWDPYTMVAVPNWIFGTLPDALCVNVYIPFENWYKGPTFFTAVYRAIGKTVSYKYVIRYEGYELIFTHELEFVGDLFTGTWTYASEYCYGNGGHSGYGAGFNGPGIVDGRWWGVNSADELFGHIGFAGNVAYGDESSDAYMVFAGDGNVTTYSPSGRVVRSGTYEIKDFDPSRPDGWEIGKLVTSEPALLFPWMINGEGVPVTEYDIMYIDNNDMTLVYTNGYDAGSWNEITYWCFERMVEGSGNVDPDQPEYCLEMINQTASETYLSQVFCQLDEPMKANTQYELRCQMRATSEHESIPIFIQTEDGHQNYGHNLTGITTSWKEMTTIITTDYRDYNSFLINIGDFVGTIFMDNISLKEIGSEKELIGNGGFDEGTDGWLWWGGCACSLVEYSTRSVVAARFDYSTLSAWYYWYITSVDGQQIGLVDGKLTINNPAVTENSWDLQYHVADNIPWVAGRTYEISMMIRASQSASFDMLVGNWSSLKTCRVDVDTEWTELSFEYIADVDDSGFVMFQSGNVPGIMELKWLEVTYNE